MTLTTKSIQPIGGEHYWALLENKLVMVSVDSNCGRVEVCGPWECGAGMEEVDLIQHVPKPVGYENAPIYY